MRVVGLLLIAGTILSPLWLLNTLLLPELEQLEYTYSHLDELTTRTFEP